MRLSHRQLHAISRDPKVLSKAIFIILGAFFLTALWLGTHRPSAPSFVSVLDQRLENIREILTKDPLDRPALLRALRKDARILAAWREDEEAPLLTPIPEADPALALQPLLTGTSALTPEEQQAFLSWHDAMASGSNTPELIARMESLTMPDAPSLPRTMAADLRRAAREFRPALAEYEAAGSSPEAIEARRRAVDLALSRDWLEDADRLLAQPAYYNAVHSVSDELARDTARHQLDIPALTRQILTYSRKGLANTDYLLLSLLAGTVWFVSLHKACRIPRRKWWISLAAFALGWLSTIPTLVLMDLQEARQGLTDSDLAGQALIFQIASVGLREEGSKLFCVLPLLLLLRKGTPAMALMAASAAGLGFAIEENISYFAMSDGVSLPGRFLTANFMHIAMTGLTGHALFRALRWPRNFGSAFLATFVGMVLIHGFYNFSQGGYDEPGFRDISGLYPFIIGGLAWYYFQTVRSEQEDAPQRLSALAVFLLGTAVLMGTLLNFFVYQHGWGLALGLFIPALLSSVILCWLFTHFLRDT